MESFAFWVEVMGWVASLLIVGSYGLNLWGKLPAQHPIYVWSNIIGGLFFVINTYYHQAYPSMLVNIIWVIIALAILLKAFFKKQKS